MASGLSATAATLESNPEDQKKIEEAAAKLAGTDTSTNSGASSDDNSLLTHPAQEKAEAKAYDTSEADKVAQQKATAAREAQIQAVQNSPWTQLSNALVKEYQSEETPVAAAVSGSQINQDEAGAANSALASLGLSSGSSAGSWLSAQTAAAQATAAPVSQAMAQEGAQYAAQEQPIENAINAYGQANALSEETAPEASWLNALASHVQSNLSYYGLVPSADVGAGGSLSGGVATALKEAGGYGGSAGAGTTPIQDVQPTAGGGTKATSAAALSGAASTGIIPAAGVSPGA